MDGGRVVYGVLGSGSLKRNPAVVTVWLAPKPVGGCRVQIRAVAVEGLFNQRTAEKAIAQLEAAIGATGAGH